MASRMCPACGIKMEYDLLTSRFVCSECGRSESALKKPEASSTEIPSKEPSTEIKEETVPETPLEEEPEKKDSSKPSYMNAIISPVMEKKKEPEKVLLEMHPGSENDPKGILRFYASAFECESVEEVLVSVEKMKSEIYLETVSGHPSLQSFQNACPKSKIPQRIRDYCETVRQILHAEEELYRSRDDVKRTEQTVKKQKKLDAVLAERAPKKDYSFRYQLLLMPLVLVIVFFFGGERHSSSTRLIPRNAETFFLLLRIAAFLYVVMFLFWFFEAVIKSVKKKRDQSIGDRLISKKSAHMDETLERIFSLQKEKEKILREILKEVESLSGTGP